MFKVVLIICLVSFASLNPIQKNPMYTEGKFEGDIMLEDLDGDGLLTYNDVKLRGLSQNPTSLRGKWTSGIVPYIIDSTYTSAQISTINDGMKIIEDQTRVNGKDCIKFVPRTNEATYIRISSLYGCNSYVGMQKRTGAQQVSLQAPGCVFTGIVAHELIHALGFWHEQSRSDRDNYIKINFANIKSGQENQFDKYIAGVDFLGFPYDLGSIMHYESTAFSKNGLPTIEAYSGFELVSASKKTSLTTIDIGEIRKYYGCA